MQKQKKLENLSFLQENSKLNFSKKVYGAASPPSDCVVTVDSSFVIKKDVCKPPVD